LKERNKGAQEEVEEEVAQSIDPRPPFPFIRFFLPRVTYYGCSATHITYTYIGFRFLAALGGARNSNVRFFVLGRAAFLSFSVRLPSKSVCPFFLHSFDWHIDFAGG
jgi:hypothetical protein